MSEDANAKEEQWKRIVIAYVERIKELEMENANLRRISAMDIANMETWKRLEEQRCRECKEGK